METQIPDQLTPVSEPQTMSTLLRQASPLALASKQRQVLNRAASQGLPQFEELLDANGLAPLSAAGIEVLQVNLGKLCNQTCRHCHVDAGPERREIMSRETMILCLAALASGGMGTLDITGGAPEMNPHFRWLVEEARRMGRRVIDRCNLTILVAPGFDDLPEFLAHNQVAIVASLPCYLESNTDRQRGSGVFLKSLEALTRLNGLGYGQPGSGLELTLVYNPLGPSLPPPQEQLEAAYRRELQARHGVVFNRLYTITNMPIGRFLDDLVRSGRDAEYLQALIDAFNSQTVGSLMCRTTLSVDWQGQLFDCDFNQMLEIGLVRPAPQTIADFDRTMLSSRRIATGYHCVGCTAGCGSSCQGAVVTDRSSR